MTDHAWAWVNKILGILITQPHTERTADAGSANLTTTRGGTATYSTK